ncbi:hypothetical protein NUKP48_45990 [Klebsiella quasipneumoniae]|nr:hypothetical protein NUKP48_45990 [Klebsiella quasipneumoniae]
MTGNPQAERRVFGIMPLAPEYADRVEITAKCSHQRFSVEDRIVFCQKTIIPQNTVG